MKCVALQTEENCTSDYKVSELWKLENWKIIVFSTVSSQYNLYKLKNQSWNLWWNVLPAKGESDCPVYFGRG